MLQTNNTGVCSKCLSHTGSAPAHGACSLPAHAAQALGCSTGKNRGQPWAACTSQVQAAQVMRFLVSAVPVSLHLPPARFSGYTTGAPSQADVDRPDPQEVLVSKETCLQFYR